MLKRLKLPDKLVKYLLAAIVVFVPLYPKFPFIKIPGTYVSIRFEDFLMFLLGFIVLAIIARKPASFLKNKINKAILIFLGIGFVSLMYAVFVTNTVEFSIGLLHWLRRVEYLIPFFAGYYYLRKYPSDIEFFYKLIIVTLFFVFLYGFGQKYFNFPVIATQNEEYSKGVALKYAATGHLSSTFAGHYDMATYLVLTLPLFIGGFVLLKNKKEKIILLITTLFGLWLLANSASRISVVSYVVASSVMLILIKKYRYILLVLLSSVIMFGMSSNLLARYNQVFEVFWEKTTETIFEKGAFSGQFIINAQEPQTLRRKTSTPTPEPIPVFEDRSTSIRFNVEWPRAIRAFTKNPILGTGYSSITLATDNDYLRLLGEVGLLGFMAFLLIIAKFVLKILKLLPLSKKLSNMNLIYVAGFAGALSGVLINAVFIDVFEASKFAIMFWLFGGFAMAIIKNSKYE